MATKKPKAAKQKSSGARSTAKVHKAAARVKPAAKAQKGAAKAKPVAKAPAKRASFPLALELAAKLGLSEHEVIARALRELAARPVLLGDAAAAPKDESRAALLDKDAVRLQPERKGPGAYLPRRLYLRLAGRGLDGGGMPVEVIDSPLTLGSGRRNTIWVNQPQIETLHVQIVQSDDGWVLEDMNTEHGTFLDGERISRRVIRDGDTFQLAGYLTVKAELR